MKGDITQGKRIEVDDHGCDLETGHIPAQGTYYKDPRDGHWHGVAPSDQDHYYACNLTNHSIVEHDDGTITVSPSILIGRPGKKQWHGYLEHGVWREV